MIPRLSNFVCLLSALAIGSAFGDEEILPWNALNGEKQFRSTVEARFPDLQFGFYHWNGDWIIGALEDFDHHRVLLLLPAEGVGSAKISRNDKDIPLPPGEPASLKVAGALITADGTVSAPENAAEQRIGYWVPLEATDKFALEAKLTWPCKGEFHSTYDPDAGWKTSYHWEVSEQDVKQSADAYEISRRSLLKRVLKVLGDQDSCLVRLKHGFDLRVTSSDGDLDAEIGSLYATLSDKIVVGSAANAEAKSPLEFERLVELYNAAARAAAVEPKVVVQVDEGADDQIFREALSALARQDYRSIGLLLKQTKEEKEEAQQSVGGQPATPPRVGD